MGVTIKVKWRGLVVLGEQLTQSSAYITSDLFCRVKVNKLIALSLEKYHIFSFLNLGMVKVRVMFRLEKITDEHPKKMEEK